MADVDSLARILGAYDLRLGRAELQAALSDDSFAEWATTHLHSDNLLTVDELTLYTELDRTGHVDTLVAGKDLSEVQGLDEKELRTAIAALERSTGTITAQTETLRKQQAIVTKLAEQRDRAASQREEFEQRRGEMRELERKRTQTGLDEAVQAMGFRTSDLEQQAKTTATAIHQTVDEMLQGDDRLLASLQKLGWELEPNNLEEDDSVKALREICIKLIKTSVETIRTKLDRIYLEALSQGGSSTGDTSTSTPDSLTDGIKATQEEIESLYLEILPVAQMATEQQHLEPALKSVSLNNTQRLGRSTAAVTYACPLLPFHTACKIQACLEHLIERAAEMASRIATAQAHQSTCLAVLAAAKGELDNPISTMPKHPRSTSLSNPTSWPPRARGRASTISTPLASRHRRGSSSAGLQDTDTDPVSALLRPLAIILPTTTTTPPTTTTTTTATARPAVVVDTPLALPILRRAHAERALKADDVARSTHAAFETTIAAHLADARDAFQTLRDSVLAESAFGPGPAPGLIDPGIEASLQVLGDEVRKAGEAVAGAERQLDAGVLSISESRDRFVKLWAVSE